MRGQQAVDAWKFARERHDKWPRTSFLAGLDMPVLRDFISAGEFVRFSKRDVLLSESHAAADAFLLLDGCVKVTAKLDAEGQALLAIRVSGDVVGEIAIMDGGDRTATVSACARETVAAVRLERDDLFGLLSRYPDAAISLTSAVSRKLRASTRRRVDMNGCAAHLRMARAVLELAEDYGRPAARGGTLIGVNLTQFELGTLIGAGETTAHRALRGLREDGLVLKAGRRLLVPDLAALHSVAWPG